MSEYEVGYGKPPEATRFAKGQSGNLKGRPRGQKNMATLLEKISQERVTVTENGRALRLTKKEIALRQLVSKALKGDMRAFSAYIALAQQAEAAADIRATASPLVLNSSQEAALLDRLRLRQDSLIPVEGSDADHE